MALSMGQVPAALGASSDYNAELAAEVVAASAEGASNNVVQAGRLAIRRNAQASKNREIANWGIVAGAALLLGVLFLVRRK